MLVLRDRAAEQPLARLGVVEQPVAQRVARDAGTSSSTASTSWAPAGSRSNVSTDCCPKRARIVSAIVCSSSSETRSTSNTRERSNVVVAPSEKTPSSSSEPRAFAAAVVDDALDLPREVLQAVVRAAGRPGR